MKDGPGGLALLIAKKATGDDDGVGGDADDALDDVIRAAKDGDRGLLGSALRAWHDAEHEAMESDDTDTDEA